MVIEQKDIGKHIVYSDGRVFGKRLKKFLKPIRCDRGYERLDINGRRQRIHRIVAECFIPNPDCLDQINHINGIRFDNRVENLEWCNSSQNQKHAYQTGLHKRMPGEINHRAILSNSEVLIIRECFTMGHKGKDIAAYFKVSPSTISMIKRGQNWASI